MRQTLKDFWDRAVNPATIIIFIMIAINAGAVLYVLSFAEDAADTAHNAQTALTLYKKEVRERRDQACDITERDERSQIESLNLTYDYLVSLKPRERKQSFNVLIFTQLPRIEEEAAFSDAPAYCDDPGIGEPEDETAIAKARPKELDPYVPPLPTPRQSQSNRRAES